MKSATGKVRSILIIQTAFLGDVVLITPLIRAVHGIFPGAPIDVLVIPETAPVLAGNPHIRSVLTFDKRKNKAGAFLRTLRRIRQHRYDLAISPHSSLTTALLMWLGGIPTRLGFDRWAAARFLTLKVPHLSGVHKARRILHLLSALSDREFDMQTEVFPTARMVAQAEAIIAGLPHRGMPVIAVFPGSIWFTKRWPEEYYSDLVRALDRLRFNIIVGGSPEERGLCETVIETSGSQAVDIAGRTDPLEAAAVVARCDLVICNDSAPMHLANAVKTSVLAIGGPTDMTKMGYFPFGAGDRVLEVDLDCRPCGSHGSRRCPEGHHRCMRDLKPELVLGEVLDHFRRLGMEIPAADNSVDKPAGTV
jgi:heptosyltransferase-2